MVYPILPQATIGTPICVHAYIANRRMRRRAQQGVNATVQRRERCALSACLAHHLAAHDTLHSRH